MNDEDTKTFAIIRYGKAMALHNRLIEEHDKKLTDEARKAAERIGDARGIRVIKKRGERLK